MNGYIAFFQGQRVEIYAETLAEASVKAREHFKPRKKDTYLVAVGLAEKDVRFDADGDPHGGEPINNIPVD